MKIEWPEYFMIVVAILFIGSAALCLRQCSKAATEIDNHGGLKAVIERAWEGKK